MSRGPWRPHAPSAHLAPRLRGRLWLCPPHVARGSVSTSQPPGPLDDPQSLLYEGPKVTPCPPRDSAAASQESRSQARASVAARGHLVVPGGLCSLRRQARELTRTLQNSPEPRRRPPVFLGQGHPHLLSQAPPRQARRWLTPKALVKERNVSRTLGGAPGGLPRGGLWPTRRTWGPQRGPPKRCPSLKFKCARGAASACEHADPGTDVGRLSVGRPISEGTQREVCV